MDQKRAQTSGFFGCYCFGTQETSGVKDRKGWEWLEHGLNRIDVEIYYYLLIYILNKVTLITLLLSPGCRRSHLNFSDLSVYPKFSPPAASTTHATRHSTAAQPLPHDTRLLVLNLDLISQFLVIQPLTSHISATDMTEPSKVIHVRNVGHEISEPDLLQLFQPFGVINKLVMLRAKNQALLQMQDVPSAVSAMQFYANVQPSIRGRNVYVQFSSHQELTTMEQNSQGRVDEPNRILLVTIHHMLYPITVEVLHQVFSPHGYVEKIVTFQKSAGFQSLIQFQLRQSAVAARNSLQGRNIYDGCCQLDIQFSNLEELQVNYNNERSRDFTNPSLPSEQKGRPSQMNNAAAIAAAFGGGLPPGISGTNDRCTVLVSNLNPDRIDEDKLFNLFSLYGNIVRIKLLRNKPDHALVQMGDGFQAELAVHFLKRATLFGKRLEVNFSKHPNITMGAETHEYLNSNLNRFNRNAAKNYRYCCSPTKMIHLSTLPQDVTEDEIISHLEEHGSIMNTKVFEMNGKKQALVLFENEEQATEALVCKHATTLADSMIRISFSQVKQRKKTTNKWNCVVCNEKQSLRKVFSQGFMAKDVRKFVQSFNMSRQFIHQPHDSQTLVQQQTQNQKRTDWSEYINDFGIGDDEEELCEPNVVTELPKPLFKKPKLRNTYSAACEDGKILGRPAFGRRNVKRKVNDPGEEPRTTVKENFKRVAENQYDHDTVDDCSVYGRSISMMTNIMKPNPKWNACADGGHGFIDTGSSSVMLKLKRPVSKWNNYIDDNADDWQIESNCEGINHAAFETKVRDEIVEDDVHPDFM
ncbi:hypothetical protein R6Q57_003124 [Mikania cordata]